MRSQPIPEYPWQFVSQDLCEFESGAYHITTVHYSEVIKVDELDNTLSSTIVEKTDAPITRHGLPERILTDNGSPPSTNSYVINIRSSTLPALLTGPKVTGNRKRLFK